MDASSRSFMRWVVVILINNICLPTDQSTHHDYQHSVAILAKNCFPPSVPCSPPIDWFVAVAVFLRRRVEALRRRSGAYPQPCEMDFSGWPLDQMDFWH